MKKENNSGFSLIELIIAIAILVILTGLLAPNVLKYVEQSREAKDVQTIDLVFEAAQVAVATDSTVTSVDTLKASDAFKTTLGVPESSLKFQSKLFAGQTISYAVEGGVVQVKVSTNKDVTPVSEGLKDVATSGEYTLGVLPAKTEKKDQ